MGLWVQGTTRGPIEVNIRRARGQPTEISHTDRAWLCGQSASSFISFLSLVTLQDCLPWIAPSDSDRGKSSDAVL